MTMQNPKSEFKKESTSNQWPVSSYQCPEIGLECSSYGLQLIIAKNRYGVCRGGACPLPSLGRPQGTPLQLNKF